MCVIFVKLISGRPDLVRRRLYVRPPSLFFTFSLPFLLIALESIYQLGDSTRTTVSTYVRVLHLLPVIFCVLLADTKIHNASRALTLLKFATGTASIRGPL